MGKITDILKTAQERAQEMGLLYEGALLPEEAYQLMCEVPSAKLVDVRSSAEWTLVGSIPGSVQIELKAFPGWRPNENFVSQLKQQVDPESIVMFICRSGGRSDEAALLASQEGYPDCYNVLEGFEGDKDNKGHRGSIAGWKAKGLPWLQG